MWVGLGAVALGLLAWGSVDLRAARRDLINARLELTQAAANLGEARDRGVSNQVRVATRHAVERTAHAKRRVDHSPPLRVAAIVPFVSTQRGALLSAARTAHDAALIADRLSAETQRVGDGLTVRTGSVELPALREFASAAERAGRELDLLPATHAAGQWRPVARATRELDTLVDDASSRLTNGAGVMRVASYLLGGDGPRRIFVALQNNAEMRDQGMVLSYAVVETANGAIHVTRSGSTVDLELRGRATDVALPVGTRAVFGSLAPDRLWQSVNATADTALSGSLVRSLYRAKTGDNIDGVIALDVPALGRLLAVTGPVTVAGITQPLDSSNAVNVLLHDLYQTTTYNNTAARELRQQQLGDVLRAVIERMRVSSLNGVAIARALGDAAAGGHAWVEATSGAGQNALRRVGLSGPPGRDHPERTFHVAVENGTATKLDWFVDPTVDFEVVLGADDSAVVTTTVTLANSAPVPTPASEQFGPDNIVTRVAGHYRGHVYLWGPSAAQQLDSVDESGQRLSFATTDVMPGQRSSVSFTTVVPHAVDHGVLQLRFVPQPRVRPVVMRVAVTGSGWKVRDAARDIPWDRTLDLTWDVHR